MGFKVTDGAEATINAVRKLMRNDTNKVLMQRDIWNAHGSLKRLAVLKSMERHPLPSSAVCLTICERWYDCCDTGAKWKRKEERAPLQRRGRVCGKEAR